MATNRYPLLMFLTALCLTVPASLWAQNTEPRFVQRLTWVGDGYATRYEVIIERDENGKYRRALQEFTTNFFIEVSLSPGKYRFQVIPYDFFNHPVPVNEWMNFEIQRAIINPEEPEDRVEVQQAALNPEEPESKVEVQQAALNPEEPESKDEITVPNPEPKKATKKQNPFDIYLGLAWLPSVTIYGGNESSDKNLSPYGAGLRLAIFSAKQNLFKFGIEGSSAWHLSPGDPPVHSLSFDFNVVARYLRGKAGLNFRMGVGVSLYINASPASVANQYAGHANFGISVLWLPLKHLYLEAGMEYVQSFGNSGSLRPLIGLGFRF